MQLQAQHQGRSGSVAPLFPHFQRIEEFPASFSCGTFSSLFRLSLSFPLLLIHSFHSPPHSFPPTNLTLSILFLILFSHLPPPPSLLPSARQVLRSTNHSHFPLQPHEVVHPESEDLALDLALLADSSHQRTTYLSRYSIIYNHRRSQQFRTCSSDASLRTTRSLRKATSQRSSSTETNIPSESKTAPSHNIPHLTPSPAGP